MKNNQTLTIEGIHWSMLRERGIIRSIFLILLLFLILFYFMLEWQPSVLIFILLGYSSAYIGFMLALTSSAAKKNMAFSDLVAMHQLHMGGLGLVYDCTSGKMEYIAPSVKSILGYTPQELHGSFSTFLFHPRDRKAIQQALQTMETKMQDNCRMEVRVMRKFDSGFLPMELIAQAVPVAPEAGYVRYIILTLHDLSEIKAKQEAEKQWTLEWMEKADRGTPAPQDFSVLEDLMTSHDLKEPLRTVKSYADLLKERHRGGLDLEGKECLAYITDGIDRMIHIIEDVAIFAKCDAYNTIFKPIDVVDVLHKAMNRNASLIQAHEATIRFRDLPEIKGDDKQLIHLFQNLIGNAIKYRSDMPPIIDVSCRMDGGYWHFMVQDNGVGIRESFQHSIFDLFQRLPSAKHESGSGVGLAICKRIVENHRGKIWVTSEGEGLGSAFHFTIPLSSDDQVQMQTERIFSYS